MITAAALRAFREPGVCGVAIHETAEIALHPGFHRRTMEHASTHNREERQQKGAAERQKDVELEELAERYLDHLPFQGEHAPLHA